MVFVISILGIMEALFEKEIAQVEGPQIEEVVDTETEKKEI